MISRSASRFAATVLAAAACAGASAASLFDYVPAAKAARAPELLAAPASILVDAAALAALAEGGILEATLPNGLRLEVRVDRITRHDNGDLSWEGEVVDARGGLRAVGTTGAAGTYAEIETSEGTWGIVPSHAGHDWLFDKTASQMNLPLPARADDFIKPPQEAAFRAKAVCPAVSSMPSTRVTIDVLAVITPDFVSAHGGAAGAETRLNNIFTSMNAYNTASNIAITYRRVGTMSVNYQAASTSNDDDAVALHAITSPAQYPTPNGAFDNVAAIRNFYGADMVAMFRGPKSTSGNSISGIAWLNGDGNGGLSASDASYMYSVSGDWTFPGATLPAHELGHNLGNAHDRPNAGTGPGTVGSTTYSYGHFVCGAGASSTCGQPGFNDTGTGFGTIMSYHRPTVAKFGSPAVMCRGPLANSLTAPCGVADQQDDVRATNCIRQTVAAFRNSWVGTCASLAADGDNDGIPDCLEAGSGKTSGVRDNDIFASGLLFAAQQYRDFLAREADAGGLNHWTSALDTGAHSRTQMVQGFLDSTEFQGAIAPVARLYFAYFLRIPDYAGLQHWIGQFKSGVPIGQISQAFANSAEFSARYGALTNSQFVSLVYNNVLGRAPDAAGLSHWTSQLNAGMTRGDMMLAFSESSEYRAIVHNEVYVTMTYMGMLRRSPDPAGFGFWTSYLDGGSTAAALVNGFLTSAEYRRRFLP